MRRTRYPVSTRGRDAHHRPCPLRSGGRVWSESKPAGEGEPVARSQGCAVVCITSRPVKAERSNHPLCPPGLDPPSTERAALSHEPMVRKCRSFGAAGFVRERAQHGLAARSSRGRRPIDPQPARSAAVGQTSSGAHDEQEDVAGDSRTDAHHAGVEDRPGWESATPYARGRQRSPAPPAPRGSAKSCAAGEDSGPVSDRGWGPPARVAANRVPMEEVSP
jgi:hypothetical protein